MYIPLSRASESEGSEGERPPQRLKFSDKVWIALVIALFALAFVVILIYGVF
jgi:hypothetical protein